jgi:TonB family protein
MGVNDKPKEDPKAKDNKNQNHTDNYDWYKNSSNKSSSGPVSAEYFLSGRTAKSTKKPTYRCKSAGKIVVNITVDPNGAVVGAEVDDAKSIGVDCIREESLKYAKMWTFDYNQSAAKKQNGTITFTFSAQ